MVNLTSLEWNQILRRERTPLTTVTALLFMIGFLGNLIVLVVYKTRMRDSHGRYFIPYLAIADLSATFVTSSFMILMDYTEGIFPSDQLCKALQFLNWSTTQASVFLLFVIAVHRYLSVCRPLDLRITRMWQRAAIAGSVVLSYSFGTPLLAFSGLVTLRVNYKGSNVTGHVCTFNPGTNKIGETVFYNILFIGNIILLCVTTALYIPIGKIIFEKFREREQSQTYGIKNQSKIADDSQNVQSASSNDAGIESRDEISTESSSVATNKIFSTRLNFQSYNLTLTKEKGVTLTPSLSLKSASKRSKSKRSWRGGIRSKFTLTLMLVVIFYIISYIPFYVMVSTGINDANVWFNLPPWRLNGNLFLYRCYIINNVVNPIIYGLFDSTFRKHFLSLCSRLFLKRISSASGK
ncbi:hypothetical protein FSP39_014332 [Pinctada imbricata]|uniref:G-protein coupled receptors family 1 profile domain-containing protein n=1 Tax=Pinctada imbricata TaxID=66713 RepID=A0AA89C6J3_PINIB|nr:hypothetical protein FSP39_014332 [Pinctada imbricata]